MLADPGIDTGPILAQGRIPVLSQDTTGTLTDKLSVIGAQLLLDVIPRWTAGQLKPRPQDKTTASYCRKIAKEDGQINWQLPAVNIWRQVRAYDPWPGSYTTWQGRQLKILAARPMGQAAGQRTGEVVQVKDKEIGFGVKTGDDILGVLAVQYEGKRIMSAADFARGQRGFIGAMLPG